MKTDLQVQQDVIAELEWEPSLDAAGIGVEVKDGVVTLAGHVGSYSEKWDAERAAQRVSGVKALAVEVEVALPAFARRNDSDIASAARNVLEWTARLPRDSVKLMVEGGWITLSGEVDWEFQRQVATATVRHLLGVTGVSDQITLKPNTSQGLIQLDIEAALRRRIRADAEHVVVEVCGDQVTLRGTARGWAERELIKGSAWGTPGVRQVHDHMTVVF